VIAAGIGDHAAAPVGARKRRDLVEGAAQFKRSDGLKIFRLEVKLAVVFRLAGGLTGRSVGLPLGLVDVRRNQFGSSGNALQARLRFANVIESDDETISTVILVDDKKGSLEHDTKTQKA
jgi:hypothetical protein